MKQETPLTLLLESKGGSDRLKRFARLVCRSCKQVLADTPDIRPTIPDAIAQVAEKVRAELGGVQAKQLLTEWTDDPALTGFHALLARELGIPAIVARLNTCCDFRRIVIATGGGANSLEGIKVGKRLSNVLGIETKVVRVIRPGAQAGDPERLSLHTGQVHDALEMQCQLLGVEAPLVVKASENVADAIIEECGEDDLIVIGGTNDWRIRRNLEGSIPDNVAHRAKCSVLMHFSPPRQELALNDVFWERTTVPDLQVPEKWAAISTLVDSLIADMQFPPDEKQMVLDKVYERENEEATCAGRGIAIPHAPLPGFRGTVGALGLCKDGIPWDEGKDPVHLVFLLVTAADDYGNYLGVLSRIARLITDEEARTRMLKSRTAADLMLTMENFEGTAFDG